MYSFLQLTAVWAGRAIITSACGAERTKQLRDKTKEFEDWWNTTGRFMADPSLRQKDEVPTAEAEVQTDYVAPEVQTVRRSPPLSPFDPPV